MGLGQRDWSLAGSAVTPEQFETFKNDWPGVNRLMEAILDVVTFEYRMSWIYANGYIYGTGGAPHTDDEANTLLYYAKLGWNLE